MKSCCQGQRAGIRSVQVAAGAGQSGRDLEQVTAADRAVWTDRSGRPIGLIQRPRLCASVAITVQALLAWLLAGGEVSERLVFEVADHELDAGVVAVIDVGGQHRDGAVGRECGGGASRGTARLELRRVGYA